MATEAATSNEAYDAASKCLERFLRTCALPRASRSRLLLLSLRISSAGLYGIPHQIPLGRWVIFNLDQLKIAIEQTEASYPVSDDRLDRALQCYKHSTFLYARRQGFAPVNSPHFLSLITSAFLNIWKAVSAVVGDPSQDAD